MAEVTLKPCPFCGGEVEPKFDYYTGVSQKHHFWQCKRDPNHRGGVGCYNMAPCKSQPSAQRGSCDKCQAENRPCIFSIAAWNTRAIEQHEAFKREVSDAIDSSVLTPETEAHLSRFIIPKPDPLVEVMQDWWDTDGYANIETFRAAIEARGGRIVWEGE